MFKEQQSVSNRTSCTKFDTAGEFNLPLKITGSLREMWRNCEINFQKSEFASSIKFAEDPVFSTLQLT